MSTLRISVATEHVCDYLCTREDGHANRRTRSIKGLWQPPTYIGFQAPVPKSPDYSTPAKVNARIREFCGTPWLAEAAADKSFAKLYREFWKLPAVAKSVPWSWVEDEHASKLDLDGQPKKVLDTPPQAGVGSAHGPQTRSPRHRHPLSPTR